MLITGKTAFYRNVDQWSTSFRPSFSVSLLQPQLLRVSHHEVHQHRPAHRGAGFQRQCTFAVASNHRLKPLNRYTMRHVKPITIAAGAGKTFSTLVLWFVQLLETSSDWSVSTFLPKTIWYLIDSKFSSTTSLIPTNNRSGPGSVFDSADVESPERLPVLLGSSAPLAVALPAIKKNDAHRHQVKGENCRQVKTCHSYERQVHSNQSGSCSDLENPFLLTNKCLFLLDIPFCLSSSLCSPRFL